MSSLVYCKGAPEKLLRVGQICVQKELSGDQQMDLGVDTERRQEYLWENY